MIIKDATQLSREELLKLKGKNVLITALQGGRGKKASKEVYVLAPHFVLYARLLAAKSYGAIVSSWLNRADLISFFTLSITHAKSILLSKGIFWKALVGLTVMDLSSISEKSNIVLNPYVVDLAMRYDRADVVKTMVSLCRRKSSGEIGLWTRNLNRLMANMSVQSLGVDFIITPSNRLHVGERLSPELLSPWIGKSKMRIISDTSTYSSIADKSFPLPGQDVLN